MNPTAGRMLYPLHVLLAEHKKAYRVKNTDGEYLAKITGKQMFNALSREDYPAVGDWVTITDLGEQQSSHTPDFTTKNNPQKKSQREE